MLNETCFIFILIFKHLYRLKLTKYVMECEIEMRPTPPLSHMNSGRRSKTQSCAGLINYGTNV